MYYKSAKLREQNNQRKAVKENDEECDSVVSNKIVAEATLEEVASNSTSNDADTDTGADVLGVTVDVDVNSDSAIEAPLIKEVANPMNYRSTLLLRGDPSKEYH